MTNFISILKTLYDNLPLILTIIAIIIGIIVYIERFMHLSKEQKKAILQEQAKRIVMLIEQQLLSIVAESEDRWGSGTGSIKKSWVWDQLATNNKELMGYIETGIVERSTIDKLIEDAVTELDQMMGQNENVPAVVDASREEGGENNEYQSELCPETDETAGGE